MSVSKRWDVLRRAFISREYPRAHIPGSRVVFGWFEGLRGYFQPMPPNHYIAIFSNCSSLEITIETNPLVLVL